MTDDRRNEAPAEDGAPTSGAMVPRAYLPSRYPPYREVSGDFVGSPDTGLDLRDILRVLNKRKWLIGVVTATFVVLGLLWTLLQTPLYTATIQLQIDRTAPKILKGAEVDPEPTGGDETGLSTEIELLKSRNLAERVASLTHFARDLGSEKPARGSSAAASPGPGHSGSELADRERAAADAILDGRTVKQKWGTRLVDVSYTDSDPVRAHKVANAFADAYIASNLDKRFQANAYAKLFLEDQIKQLKLRLEDSEKVLLAFAEKEQIVVTADKTSVAESNLAAANSALGAIVAERIKNEQLWRQAEKAAGIEVPQILTNRAIDDLRSRRSHLVADYQEKSETFRAEYPAMVQLSNQIKEIDRQIGIEVKTIKSSLEAAFDASLSQENEMKRRIEKLREETLDLQKRSVQYNILKREVDTNRSLYESLLQRYKEVDVASGVSANNVFIVDRAQLPGAPSFPHRSKALLLALALGLGAGVAVAFLFEKFDDCIYSPLEAEEASGLALLGVIPRVKQAWDADPRSAVSEAFRSACTSLQFSTESGVPKTLTITSARPTEGKSSTVMGIARQFAAMGLKVLVLDADLRKPTLHETTGLGNSVGLSTYLTGNCEVKDVIQRIEPTTLHLVTSGPLPPNPVELLNGPRFASLLSVGREVYDLTIVDAPPIMGMADALVLANMTSATLVVIAARQARVRHVRYALKRLTQARVTLIGFIFNKFDAKTAKYGYGYEYGYGGEGEYTYGHDLDEVTEATTKLIKDASDGLRKLKDGSTVT